MELDELLSNISQERSGDCQFKDLLRVVHIRAWVLVLRFRNNVQDERYTLAAMSKASSGVPVGSPERKTLGSYLLEEYVKKSNPQLSRLSR